MGFISRFKDGLTLRSQLIKFRTIISLRENTEFSVTAEKVFNNI